MPFAEIFTAKISAENRGPQPKYFGRYLAVVLLVITAGCAPPDTGPSKLDNYLSRLSHALETEVPAPPFIAPPRIADAGLSPIEPAPASIGVLDFLSLSGCELQINLGRRNSSLGRHASASQRLLLDLEFLDLAPACIEFLLHNNEAELANEIQQIAASRRQALPTLIYNAIFTGPEFRAFWHLPATLDNYPNNTSGDVIDALHWLNQRVERWLAGDYQESLNAKLGDATDGRADRFGRGALELQLSTLREGDGGALMLAVSEQARTLAQASELLLMRADQRPLCPKGNQTGAAKITRTVVVKFFAGDVQGWLAQLNQRSGALRNALHDLESQLAPVLPSDYRQWRERRDQLLTKLQTAPRGHVQAIKTALDGCPSLPWG